MANIESGHIYNVEISGYLFKEYYKENYEGKDAYFNATVREYYDWILKRLSTVLKINSSYFDLTMVENGNAYFNLPCINNPEENARLKIFFQTRDDVGLDDLCYKESIDLRLTYVNNNNYPLEPEYSKIIHNTDIMEYDTKFYKSVGNSYSINGLNPVSIQIDTRFLASHGFYTFGVYNIDNIHLPSTGKEITNYWLSPCNFICDMKDSLTSKHSDALIFLPSTSFYEDKDKLVNTLKNEEIVKKELLYTGGGIGYITRIIPIIALTKNLAGNYEYDIQNYAPQIFAKQGSTEFTIEKIHCGNLYCAKNLYIGRTGVILGKKFFETIYESQANVTGKITDNWFFDYFTYTGKKYSVGLPIYSQHSNFIPIITNVSFIERNIIGNIGGGIYGKYYYGS